jgi:hypothetical protein
VSKRTKRKSENESGSTSISITSFLYGAEEKKPKEQEKPVEVKEVEKHEEVKQSMKISESQGIESEVLNHIMSRGSVTKDELMAWGKSRGLRVSDVLRAIEALTSSGRIVKRLNDKGNLVYVYVK